MSTMNPGPTPPGWYPQDGQLRYWDGHQWTNQTAPLVGTGQPVGPFPGGPVGHPATPTTAAAQADQVKRPWYRKKRILIPIASVVAIGALSNLTGGGKTDPTTPVADATPVATATSSQPAKAAAAKTTEAKAPATTSPAPPKPASQLGQPVRDGKFEFVVKDVKCGIGRVGDEYLNKTPQGQFCSVGVTVTNIGDEPQSMFADNQYAFDGQGRRFSASSEAAIYADDSKLLFEEINPGNTLSGRVYFDMPKGQSPVKLKLYDSAFSGGVEVRLS